MPLDKANIDEGKIFIELCSDNELHDWNQRREEEGEGGGGGRFQRAIYGLRMIYIEILADLNLVKIS